MPQPSVTRLRVHLNERKLFNNVMPQLQPVISHTHVSYLGTISQDPSVSKSNRLDVVIFQGFLY